MGKSEILMLIAGVVLSIALALVTIPLFSSSSEMTKKVQFKHEIISLINHHDIWTQGLELNPYLNYADSYASNMRDITAVGNKVKFKSENECTIEFVSDSVTNEVDKNKIEQLICYTSKGLSEGAYTEIKGEIENILYDKKIEYKAPNLKIDITPNG